MFKPVSLVGNIFKFYINSFSHPAKIRLQNFIGKILFPKGIKLKDSNGLFFCLNANDWITRIILIEGSYEKESTKLAKKLVNDGGNFIDIGANFGLFTCIVAYNNNKVKVFSVEPNYKILPTLINNIKLNKLENNCIVINTALSKTSQFVTLSQPSSNNMGTVVTSRNINAQQSILSCHLDFLLSEYELKNIQLLKIDIEGNEFDVFQFFPFEKFTINNIILEFNHLSQLTLLDLCSFFSAKGFKAYNILGDELDTNYSKIIEHNVWFKRIDIT